MSGVVTKLAVVAHEVIGVCNASFASHSRRGFETIRGMLAPWSQLAAVAEVRRMCLADRGSPRLAYPHIAAVMEDIVREHTPVTVDGPVTHIAGVFVGLAGRIIQRCACCGYKLVDNKNTASPDGATMSTWASGALVEIDGNRSSMVGMYEDPNPLPANFCINLVE